MKILKFGGTSVGTAERMHSVAKIVAAEQEVVVVLSAVAGTTDCLTSVIESVKSGDCNAAIAIVEELRHRFKGYIAELLNSEPHQINAIKLVDTHLDEITDLINQPYLDKNEFVILSKGEIISTSLFSLLTQELAIPSRLFFSPDFLRLTAEGVPDEIFLKVEFNRLISQQGTNGIIITQGFICSDLKGGISNLRRGGSDYSASLFGAAIDSEEIQIWTDIDGMHNNDPRFIENTKPIRELSFDEAAELAYFGAKILHPSSIKPARKKNIPVRLLNTLEPSAAGTLISEVTIRGSIKAVAAKSGITAIKIRSSEMLQAPGFLRRIFEVFELYKTSIDVVTTSEVAVSVTIDDTHNLQAIVKTLEEFGQVEVDTSLSIICVVGKFLVENSGLASQVIKSLQDIPIRMISYGGSAHNISLLVSEEHKVIALKALHRGLFDTNIEYI